VWGGHIIHSLTTSQHNKENKMTTNIMHIDFPIEDNKLDKNNWKSVFSEVLSYSRTYSGDAVVSELYFLIYDIKDDNKSMEEAFDLVINNESVIYNFLGKKRESSQLLIWHRAVISYVISRVYKEEYNKNFPHLKRDEVSKILWGENKKVVVTIPCKRCCGAGGFPHFAHIKGGVCFRCDGLGVEIAK
jgi:hypothetical protein